MDRGYWEVMIQDMAMLKNKLDIKELIQFYYTLERDFAHLCWQPSYKECKANSKHILNGMRGWALQSNQLDLTKPCPPYNITSEEKLEYKDTAAMFGIAKRLRSVFPYAHQFSISEHPPGAMINFHTDTRDYLKVHIPIITNDKAWFQFESSRQFVLPADGSMILINTQIPHGTINSGTTKRVHLFFKIPAEKEKEILAYDNKELQSSKHS